MSNRVIGSFRIERELGVGGMGVVYLGTHLDSGRQVALKVMSQDRVQSPQVAERFEREVAILKKLRHKNVVRYYGGGVYDGQRYCVMEVLD
ncbi:MAG: protein kinase, partial [Planctomycetaceae bacterium]